MPSATLLGRRRAMHDVCGSLSSLVSIPPPGWRGHPSARNMQPAGMRSVRCASWASRGSERRCGGRTDCLSSPFGSGARPCGWPIARRAPSRASWRPVRDGGGDCDDCGGKASPPARWGRASVGVGARVMRKKRRLADLVVRRVAMGGCQCVRALFVCMMLCPQAGVGRVAPCGSGARACGWRVEKRSHNLELRCARSH